jgi:hypothetical protein
MAEQRAIILYSDDREESASYRYVHTPYVAGTLLDDGLFDETALQEAMQRAVQVCLYMRVPIWQHFRHIYVHNASGHVQDDWALSDLALYLLLLNGNTASAAAAFAQAYAVRNIFGRNSPKFP